MLAVAGFGDRQPASGRVWTWTMLIGIAVLLSVSRNHFVCYCWVWRCGDGRGGRGGAGEAASLMSIFCRGLRTLGCAEPHGFVSSLSLCIYTVYLLCVSTLCIYTVYLLYVSKSISGHCIVSAPRAGPHSTWSKLVLSASGSRRCRRRRRRWRAGVRCGELATGPPQWREERRRIHHPVADLDTATHHSMYPHW